MNGIEFTYENDDGDEIRVVFPGEWEVCPGCRGNGKHVHRAIDGNGITASEWAEWDQDDREDYLSGVYDVTCEECNGRTTVLVIDEEAAKKAYPEAWEAYCDRESSDSQERANERYWTRMSESARMGLARMPPGKPGAPGLRRWKGRLPNIGENQCSSLPRSFLSAPAP